MTLEQLKVRGWDLLTAIQSLQFELKQINQEIAKQLDRPAPKPDNKDKADANS